MEACKSHVLSMACVTVQYQLRHQGHGCVVCHILAKLQGSAHLEQSVVFGGAQVSCMWYGMWVPCILDLGIRDEEGICVWDTCCLLINVFECGKGMGTHSVSLAMNVIEGTSVKGCVGCKDCFHCDT